MTGDVGMTEPRVERPGAADPIERARTLVPVLEAHAAEAEELRALAPAVLEAATDSGLFRMLVPRGRGGEGRSLRELVDTTRVLAAGCPASAWTLSFLVMHNWLLTRFPERLQDEVMGGEPGYGLVPAPLAPTGSLRAAVGPDGEPGWTVRGRWEWATGVRHADWVMVTGLEDRDDAFVARFAVLPIDDVVVEDVWRTSGMRATGSDTVVVDGAFVPDHRTVVADDLLLPRAPDPDHDMASLPVMAVLALTAAAPAVGAAEQAVELYRQRIRERVLAYSFGDRAIDQPAAQVRLGTALADVRAARAVLDGAVDELERTFGAAADAPERGGGEGGDADGGIATRMAVRLAAADAVRRSVAVVADVCAGAGASVYFADSPLQRLQRDVEVLKGHVVFDWDRTTELAGRLALGLPLRPADRI